MPKPNPVRIHVRKNNRQVPYLAEVNNKYAGGATPIDAAVNLLVKIATGHHPEIA